MNEDPVMRGLDWLERVAHRLPVWGGLPLFWLLVMPTVIVCMFWDMGRTAKEMAKEWPNHD